MLTDLLLRLNTVLSRFQRVVRATLNSAVLKFSFLPKFYKYTDLIWQDGLIIDFLQKKFADRFIRTFLIYSSYLFSERVLFDFVTRFYIDAIVWPTTKVSALEAPSVASLFAVTLLLFLSVVFFLNLSSLYWLVF